MPKSSRGRHSLKRRQREALEAGDPLGRRLAEERTARRILMLSICLGVLTGGK